MFPVTALELQAFEALGGASTNEDAPTSKPWSTASKAEWSAYAASCGIGIDGLTKAQIIEACK